MNSGHVILILCFLIACSVEKKTNQIFVEISPEKLTLDEKTIKNEYSCHH